MDDVTFTRVFATGSLGVIAVAKSLLEAAGIEYFTKNERRNPPIEIWVRAADVQESRALLKDLTEGGRPASD
jgi:putative signal transducing protein